METNSDKIQQNRTESGLTPIQEQAAILMASGESITAIAEKLEINRSTIYEWQGILTFRCFFNKQCEAIRERMKAGLFGLQEEAFKAIKDILTGDNPAMKLKAATWLLDKVAEVGIGETDPIPILKEECGLSWHNRSNDWEKYGRLLEEYHLQDEDRYIPPQR